MVFVLKKPCSSTLKPTYIFISNTKLYAISFIFHNDFVFSCSQSVINHGLCVNLQLILFETYL